MLRHLINSFGIDTDAIPQSSELVFRFENAHWFSGWSGILCLSICLGVLLFIIYAYRHELKSCPAYLRYLMSGMRIFTIAILFFILLGPVIDIYHRHEHVPTIALLVDQSRSMNMADNLKHNLSDETVDTNLASIDANRIAVATNLSVQTLIESPPTRETLAGHLLNERKRDTLRSLLQKNHLMLAPFHDQLLQQDAILFSATSTNLNLQNDDKNNEPNDDQSLILSKFDFHEWIRKQSLGDRTDISDAIQSVALTASDQDTPSAVVMITDGQHSESLRMPLQIAKLLKNKSIPFFPVGMGSSVSRPNLELINFHSEPAVWEKDPVKLEVTYSIKSFKQLALLQTLYPNLNINQIRIDVSKVEIQSGGQESETSVIKTKKIDLTQDLATSPNDNLTKTSTIEIPPLPHGRYRLIARINFQGVMANQTADIEDNVEDNIKDTLIESRNDKSKILLISGSASWEYRFLLAHLKRNESVSVSGWLQSMDIDMPQDGDIKLAGFPRSEEDIFQYDLIILIDPNPKDFDESWINKLKAYLSEHGGGLVYMAGPQYAAQFLTSIRTKMLANLLPVKFDDLTRMDVKSLLMDHEQSWPLRMNRANIDHPILAFSNERQSNMGIWQKFPGIYWSFPATAIKPATVSLIDHPNPSYRTGKHRRPLMVTAQYGPGRTLYMGMQSTWRWRKLGQQHMYYEQFWGQVIHFLIDGRLLKGQRRGNLLADKTRATLGENVLVKGRFLDKQYQAIVQPTYPISVQWPSGLEETYQLKAIKDQPGNYQLKLTMREPGMVNANVNLPQYDKHGTVIDPININLPILVNQIDIEMRETSQNQVLLKDMARLSGGKYLSPDQFNLLSQLIKSDTEIDMLPGKPILLWDHWRIWLILVLLTCTEWFLRKSKRLL